LISALIYQNYRDNSKSICARFAGMVFKKSGEIDPGVENPKIAKDVPFDPPEKLQTEI